MDKDNKEVALSKYAGHVTIVVNVASQCGYTQQNYKGLVELYREFKDKGFEVVRLCTVGWAYVPSCKCGQQASITGMHVLCSWPSLATLSANRSQAAAARSSTLLRSTSTPPFRSSTRCASGACMEHVPLLCDLEHTARTTTTAGTTCRCIPTCMRCVMSVLAKLGHSLPADRGQWPKHAPCVQVPQGSHAAGAWRRRRR